MLYRTDAMNIKRKVMTWGSQYRFLDKYIKETVVSCTLAQRYYVILFTELP